MEEEKMENDLKKAALPDEGMEAATGGGTMADALAGLDVIGLIEKPLRTAYEAQVLTSEATRAFIELEQRKTGLKDKQSQ